MGPRCIVAVALVGLIKEVLQQLVVAEGADMPNREEVLNTLFELMLRGLGTR